MRNTAKLKVGHLYAITFRWGKVMAYYDGPCDAFFHTECYCCGRKLKGGHEFLVPSGNVTYEQCKAGAWTEQIKLGTTCINKMSVEEYQG